MSVHRAAEQWRQLFLGAAGLLVSAASFAQAGDFVPITNERLHEHIAASPVNWLLLKEMPLMMVLMAAIGGFGLSGVGYQLVANVFMFTFLLTPIIWHAESMPADSLRGTAMRLNPFFHLVEAVRAPLLGDPVEMLTLGYLAAMTVLGWLLAAAAYRRFAHYVPLWV